MGLDLGVATLAGSTISAGANLLGGAVNNLLANHAAKKQYKYQRKLNDQQFEHQQQLNATQQEYAQQNAHNDYMRQRELTQDQYSLMQQGKKDAGINTAFDGGSQSVANTNTTAAPSAGSASAGSAPSIGVADVGLAGAGNALQAGIDNLLRVPSAENQIIQNSRDSVKLAVERAKAKNEIERTLSGKDKESQEALKVLNDNEYFEKVRDVRLKSEELNKIGLQLQNDLMESEKVLKQDAHKYNSQQLRIITNEANKWFEQYMLKVKQQLADLKLTASKTKEALSAVRLNYANAANADAQRFYTQVLTNLERAKIPYAGEIAAQLAIQARKATELSILDLEQRYMLEPLLLDKSKHERWKMRNEENAYSEFGENMRQIFGGWSSGLSTAAGAAAGAAAGSGKLRVPKGSGMIYKGYTPSFQ